MKTTEETMNQHQSIELIQNMIHVAKSGIKDNGFFYLLWGWLVFIAAVSEYIFIYHLENPFPGMFWAILMPLGAITSMIYGRMKRRKEKVKTYVNELMSYVLIAYLVSLFITLFSISIIGPRYAYPFIIIMYAIWGFISGGALRFKPLIWGGIINWVIAITCFFVTFQYQLLLLALAVLLGYIIPGHILKSKYKND
jgi:hypothetical protein